MALSQDFLTEYKAEPSFIAFMQAANAVIEKVAGGLGLEDFADADWRSAFEDWEQDGEGFTSEEFAQATCEVLAEADGIFAELFAVQGGGRAV